VWKWAVGLLLAAPVTAAAQPPPGLPRYDVAIDLDVHKHTVQVVQRVTWTNLGKKPTREIVFNAHAHYSIPDKDVGLLAKTSELLRMSPSESMSFDGPPLEVRTVTLLGYERELRPVWTAPPGGVALAHTYPEDNPTALVIPLDREVAPGEAATIELDFTLKLPPRKGRWGQWDHITTLAQWLPVTAFYGEHGWEPAPFIPWHQPYFNEAGHYTVRLKVSCDQRVAATAPVRTRRELGDDWQLIEFEPICVRDFTLVCSHRFSEWRAWADGVQVCCLAPPEHEFYAQLLLRTVCEALPVYNRWFGRYPYKQFTIVESCFGWNGNECGCLVMIDDRVFKFPHMARNYPAYLVQHELCHQWWYNVVGTNGYCETWMDEGLATYFSHCLANDQLGANNAVLVYPEWLSWAPNINRDDLRNYGMFGAWARGDANPTIQKLPDYKHLANLMSATYDRGSKVVGLIEERLGHEAFLDFMRFIYHKYQFRILRVADFQRELEAWTHQSWEEFFQYWIKGSGMCDWAVHSVSIDDQPAWRSVFQARRQRTAPVRVVVRVKQLGGFNEPTVLGVRLEPGKGFALRIPINPNVPLLQMDDPPVKVECHVSPAGGSAKKATADVRVEMVLPCVPDQITIDPDHIQLDLHPTNNQWRNECRWRLTPAYTMLDETDVTNAYDRWNITAGPWFYFSSFNNPWFTVSPLIGVRAGIYRTQEFYGGTFLAYRTNDRNIVAGADALWDHVPLPNTQVGLWLEKSIATLGPEDIPTSRVVFYTRYVMMYGSSLYLPPFEYVEAFGAVQNRGLPVPLASPPGADPFNTRPSLGTHYHKYLLTPYWDPEGGLAFDATYEYGLPIFGNQRSFQELFGQVSWVSHMPKFLSWDGATSDWLQSTRWAFRLGGASSLPSNGEFFALGGGNMFRGFDLNQRQGSMLWLGSAEWRLPVLQNSDLDFCDHVAGLRNAYLVPFYDVGNAYVSGRALGNTAHAVGCGMRLDVTWLGIIERTMLRFDVAKTINVNAPWQVWFGIMHPF
jgi:hypothetical protein